jgi:hypothetical protein
VVIALFVSQALQHWRRLAGVVGGGPDLLGETKEKAALTKVVNARSEFLEGKNSNSADLGETILPRS